MLVRLLACAPLSLRVGVALPTYLSIFYFSACKQCASLIRALPAANAALSIMREIKRIKSHEDVAEGLGNAAAVAAAAAGIPGQLAARRLLLLEQVQLDRARALGVEKVLKTMRW